MSEQHRPEVTGFFHEETNSVAYVCAEPATRRCAVIDPVLDFDRNARATYTDFADRMLGFVREQGLKVEWILDTHPHADHFSAAPYLKEKLGAPMAIGSCVVTVQRIWKEIYNLPDFPADGSQWDRRFDDGERFRIGGIEAEVLFTPGHTAASIAYRIGDAAFVHDTLFMPDSAPPAPTSRAATRAPSGAPSAGCWRCLPQPASSLGTTTCREAASRAGSPPWRSSARTTSTSMTASRRRSSCASARSVTPGCRCPR